MKNQKIIEKLIAAAEKIQSYCKDYDYDAFFEDSKCVEACVFNLSQMGEWVKHIDKSYQKENASIPWNAIYGLRNRIVHDYEGVNLRLVWEIIEDDLPVLKVQLQELLM